MLEVEIKIKAYNPEAVKKKIAELGGKFLALEKQVDIYFNHPGRDFGETDEALRLRQVNGRVELTYKGRKIDNITKSREEITVEVDDLELAKNILVKLGFSPVREVVKEREVYTLGDYLVMVDNVEKLGTYVEIEKKSEGYTAEELLKFVESLSLNPKEVERKSYLELLLEAEDDS